MSASRVPSRALQQVLDELYASLLGNREGEVATYIPELGKANPDEFGICIVTVDGVVYEAGHTDVPFTIQSVSKPFTLALALEDNSEATVLSRVGVEPTSEPFNVYSVDSAGLPKNPMINAGAITATCLVGGETADDKAKRILERFSAFAGRALDIDESVYRSESETGHRNRGFAHLLRQSGAIPGGDVVSLVEVYFKQCSVKVTARDLVSGWHAVRAAG